MTLTIDYSINYLDDTVNEAQKIVMKLSFSDQNFIHE